MPETPEQKARREIDADLAAAGWLVQGGDWLGLTAGRADPDDYRFGKAHTLFGDQLKPLITELNTRLAA